MESGSDALPAPGPEPEVAAVTGVRWRAPRGVIALLVAAAFIAGIVYLAWPVSAAPASRVVDLVASGSPLPHWAEADRNLAVWVLSWTARAALDPGREFFQADLFYPAPDTLASSENLLGLLPVSLPTFLLSGNPILTHNLTLFAVIFVLALFTFFLVRDWTGSASAGFLAGTILGFAPIVVAMWSNVISASAVHLFPIVLLLAIRAARRPRWWTLLGLTLAVALEVLSGLYVAYQLLVIVVVFAPAAWWEARRNDRPAWPVLVALGAGFLVLLPLSLPYLRVRATGVLPNFETARAIASALGLSGQIIGQRIVDNVGWTALALALVAILRVRRTDWHLRIALVAIAVVGAVLAMGPGVPLIPGTSLPGVYDIAMRVVPGFSSMRAPGRFLILPVLSIALLAGVGAADLLAMVRVRTVTLLANALVLLAGVGMIVSRAPARPLVSVQMPATASEWEPYRWLRKHGDGKAVLELPAMVTPLDLPFLRATGGYLIGSAVHDLPLVNGYSGHQPPTAELLLALAQRLPDPRAYEQLCASVDVGWIVVHLDDKESEDAWRDAQEALGLDLAAEFPGPVRIYRPRRACGSLQPRLLAQLRGEGRDTTLLGNALSELDATDRRGRIEIPDQALPARQHTWLWADVTNEGGRTWPGFTITVPEAVEVQSRFRDPKTGRVLNSAIASPLGVDLEPGGSLRLLVAAQVPPPGEYVLEIGLVQNGRGWFADQPGGGVIARLPVTVRASAAEAQPTVDPG